MTKKAEPTVYISKNQPQTTSLVRDALLKRIVFIVVALVVLIVLYEVIDKIHRDNLKVATVNICTQPANISTLAQAETDIRTNNLSGLGAEVSQIEELSGYQRDPNCLYALVNYHLELSDYSGAVSYFNDLQKVYNPKQGFSHVLYDPVSIATLKADIATLKTENSEAQKNQEGFPTKDLPK